MAQNTTFNLDKAIILAGGLGTRLRPITYEIPKPLIPVRKKPILNHLIEFLGRYNIEAVGLIVSADHRNDFEKWQKDWRGQLSIKELRIFIEEKPSGTFGWLRNVRDWIGEQSFVLTNGDHLLDFDLNQLKSFHDEHESVATIALVEVSDPEEYGTPVLRGHHVIEFQEKSANPYSNFVSAGFYILEPDIFKYDDLSRDYLMIETDIYPKVAKDLKLLGYKITQGRFYDCGTPERWQRAIKEW